MKRLEAEKDSSMGVASAVLFRPDLLRADQEPPRKCYEDTVKVRQQWCDREKRRKSP